MLFQIHSVQPHSDCFSLSFSTVPLHTGLCPSRLLGRLHIQAVKKKRLMIYFQLEGSRS